MTQADLLEYDRTHVWHPYTSMTEPLPVYPVKKAEGCLIHLEDGRTLIDGMSSWWAAIHGYNHPVLNKAIEEQLSSMAHIMFGGLTHTPAVELARRLVSITPKGLEKVFFSDSGSVAVEVAMKMAVQYQMARGNNAKCQFATFCDGYHGDTWHAMSVCDPVTGMHHLFEKGLPVQHFLPRPGIAFSQVWDSAEEAQLTSFFEANSHCLAGFIVEPIVQGAGGMWFYNSEYLRVISRLCKQHNVLLLADEIATGFGRTGELFACNHADVVPDIMCLGKAITGGYMSFAATLCTSEVAETISDAAPGVFMHGPTFMGNPLACSVACASIDLLGDGSWQHRVKDIELALSKGLEPARGLQGVANVRCLGAIGVVELDESVAMADIQASFVEHGVWVRPFGRLVYLMPPYIISMEQLEVLCAAVISVLEQHKSSVSFSNSITD